MFSGLLQSCVALIALSGAAAGTALGDFGSVSTNQLFGRADEEFNQDDLSFIKRIAAIGDSYSAGIGAGDRLTGPGDDECRRYDHSYPYLLNQDDRLGDPEFRFFQFESCSGAVIKDAIEEQIPAINYNQDVILISAGGNDAELVHILNQCVYQWLVFNKEQSWVGRLAEMLDEWWAKGWNWETNARGCQMQLTISDDIIKSRDFSDRLDRLIAAAKERLAPNGHIYYTGYAKFFATDYSPECDDVTWSTWTHTTYNAGLPPERLDSFNRIRMNGLVDRMNEQLAAAVKRAGDKVTFINYDEYAGYFKGRFCEKGVDEGSILKTSGERPQSMFYRLNSFDPAGRSPWKRSVHVHKNSTFAGDINHFARAVEYLDDEARLRYEEFAEDDPSTAVLAAENKLAAANEGVPNYLPDGYGRVFHPQILLHNIIAKRVLFEISNRNLIANGFDPDPLINEPPSSCPIDPGDGVDTVLRYKETAAGKPVKEGTKLRILGVGDSITVGFPSRGDGDGYRRQLKRNLSGDEVVFAGTESKGSMSDGYFAAWSGKTIQYISDRVGPSLRQRPNIILLAAGTNDMNANPNVSKEGNDPQGAAERLGKMIDKMVDACPDATILVAMIVNTCSETQSARTKEFQKLIPGVVQSRKDNGHHVLAVDFTTFKTGDLADCIHPTPDGYKIMGDYWYSFIHQIPSSWIRNPVGSDPEREGNGELDPNIPAPDWGTSPIQVTSKAAIKEAADSARGGQNGPATCKTNPRWRATGKIALGLGKSGAWKYGRDWRSAGKVAAGLGWDKRHVRLHDMNGDGKADYVWIHPDTGEIRCWLNNLPEPWSPAGTSNSIIGSGVGPAETIFLADMNGDGKDDYLVVDGQQGSVRVWWNYGPDPNWHNGWKFVGGGQIASGVPYANLKTLRFPDINGDGRADYVVIGKGGSLKHHLNTGSPGGEDVLFRAMGGIATGAASDISKLVFADMNGDGRDDYLVWDTDGGLTGFLNKPTNREGVPLYVSQGPAKTIAEGIGQDPSSIRLADMDGDGRDDYVYVGDNGALNVWYNRGETDDSMARDGIHFADINGDGLDDYIWLDPKSGAPTVYLNRGVDDSDVLGWRWSPLNGGKPIASGAAPSSQIVFGDIDGDGLDDYLDLDPKTGALKAYLNLGEDKTFEYGWKFTSIGTIASGLGPGKRVRIADIDGDGRDDYIYLKDNGGTTIYRNIWSPTNKGHKYSPMPDADASGIGQSPDEIDFVDIDGDGKADYVWTRKIDGRALVWYNDYPKKPTWRAGGEIAGGIGTSGANVKYAKLLSTGRSDYVPVDPNSGAIGAWLNGCGEVYSSERRYRVTIMRGQPGSTNPHWLVIEHHLGSNGQFTSEELCMSLLAPDPDEEEDPVNFEVAGIIEGTGRRQGDFPSVIASDMMAKIYGKTCYYKGLPGTVGKLICDGVTGIRCRKAPDFDKKYQCTSYGFSPSVDCDWE